MSDSVYMYADIETGWLLSMLYIKCAWLLNSSVLFDKWTLQDF